MADRWTTYDCYGTLIDWRQGIGDVLGRLFGEQHRARLLGRYYEVEAAIQADGYRTYRDVLDLGTARIADEEGRELAPDERTAMSNRCATGRRSPIPGVRSGSFAVVAGSSPSCPTATAT